MATVRKLAPDEVQALKRRGARVDLAPYGEALADLSVGDWGAIDLSPEDKITTVKRRYTVAAKQQGKKLAYKRLRDGALPFEVRQLA